MGDEFEIKICCIGAGYVGGPTMAVIAKKCPKVRSQLLIFYRHSLLGRVATEEAMLGRDYFLSSSFGDSFYSRTRPWRENVNGSGQLSRQPALAGSIPNNDRTTDPR